MPCSLSWISQFPEPLSDHSPLTAKLPEWDCKLAPQPPSRGPTGHPTAPAPLSQRPSLRRTGGLLSLRESGGPRADRADAAMGPRREDGHRTSAQAGSVASRRVARNRCPKPRLPDTSARARPAGKCRDCREGLSPAAPAPCLAAGGGARGSPGARAAVASRGDPGGGRILPDPRVFSSQISLTPKRPKA